MANQICDAAVDALLKGDIDFENDTIKIALVKAISFDPATDVYLSDLATFTELAAASYVRKTLGSKTVTKSSGYSVFDAASPVWAVLESGETIIGAVVFKFVTVDADSPIITYLDTTDLPTNGQQVTFDFSASGILKLSRKAGS